MSKHRVLIVDDEPAVRFGIREFLELHGYEVEEADTCRGGEERFRATRPDAVVLDYMLPDGDALGLMGRLVAADPAVPHVILTAHGSIELAVAAIKNGADQFLTKPVELDSLRIILDRVLESRRDRRTHLALRAREARSDVEPFTGPSGAIRRLAEDARRFLRSDSPILLHGPTGSGKGVLARWLHRTSTRADEAFVDLNCAGLSREFLESELFGHERGAFTGAVASKQGMLELAHRGTVFLDEIGDVHPEVQPKLLKVLEEKRFRRMGEIRERLVDIRLIAATHYDLQALVREGRFRSDLYFRISTFPLEVPALRERVEDIPVLVEGILRRLAPELGRTHIRLTAAAHEALRRYTWPGNIRELRNVLERAVLLRQGEWIEPCDLRFDYVEAAGPPVPAADLTLFELERRHIERVLQEEGGRVESTARRLGIPRSTLYQKLKRFELRSSEEVSAE